MNKLSPLVGREFCEEFLIHEVASLADDPIFRVRKATVMNIASVAKTVSTDSFLAKVYPLYIK